jgi:hypothetical protein
MDERISREIGKLKEVYRQERESAVALEQLVHGPIDIPVKTDLWELSDQELDQEMGRRLSCLNDDIDCRPQGPLSSHRRFIGPFIVRVKKALRRALSPYTNMLFLRQNGFNADLVAFHLAAFIRFRRLEKRMEELEEQSRELPDGRNTTGEGLAQAENPTPRARRAPRAPRARPSRKNGAR